MRFTIHVPAVLLAVFVPAAALLAQGSQPAPKTAENQIALDVTVTTRANEPVEGLTAADFKILDNKNPEPITSFRALTGAATRTEVVLVVDDVNLPYERLSFARQQIVQFLTAHDGKLAQPTSLAVLENTGMKVQPEFTTDGNALRASLDNYAIGLRSIPRSAGFYGAAERFQVSLEALHRLVDREASRPGRKLIVWVSTGWPLLSGPGVELSSGQMRALFSNIVALSTEMREAHITLDAVNPFGTAEDLSVLTYYENFLKGARDAQQVEIGNLGLQVVAVQSGGVVLNGSNDIAGMLQRCFTQTQDIYELSFAGAPGEHANEYHAIQVQMEKPGLTAHTRTGYYARPTYTGTTVAKAPAVSPTK
jgi:VWFA-related protein